MSEDRPGPGSAGGSASPGPGAGGWRVLEPLGEAECMQLLAGARLGRLIYTSRYGPTALPVTFTIDQGSVVAGTWDPVLLDEDLRTGIERAEYQIAMEADHIDVDARLGWFVLLRGAAHHLDTEAEREPFAGAGLEPWLKGIPAHYIRVTPTSIRGNRIRPA